MDRKTKNIILISTIVIVLLALISYGVARSRKGLVGKKPLKGWEIVKIKYDNFIFEKKDNGWFLTSPHFYQVDSAYFYSKLNDLKHFKFGEFIDKGNLEEYGLGKERKKLVVYLKNGDTLVLYMGKRGPISTSFYTTMDTSSVYLGYGLPVPLFPKNERVFLKKKVYSFTEVDSMKVFKGDKLLKRYRDTLYTNELSKFLPQLKAFDFIWKTDTLKPAWTMKIYTPQGEFQDKIAEDKKVKGNYLILRDSVALKISGFRLKKYLNPPHPGK